MFLGHIASTTAYFSNDNPRGIKLFQIMVDVSRDLLHSIIQGSKIDLIARRGLFKMLLGNNCLSVLLIVSYVDISLFASHFSLPSLYLFVFMFCLLLFHFFSCQSGHFFLIPWRPVPFKLFKSNSHQINGRIYYSVSHTLAVLALFYRTRFPLSAIVINFHHPVFKIPHATVSWDITSFSCLLTPFAADSCYGKQQCLNFS